MFQKNYSDLNELLLSYLLLVDNGDIDNKVCVRQNIDFLLIYIYSVMLLMIYWNNVIVTEYNIMDMLIYLHCHVTKYCSSYSVYIYFL